MGKIRVHDKDEVSSCMFYAMEVSGSFQKVLRLLMNVTSVSTVNELHFSTYLAPVLMVLVAEPAPQNDLRLEHYYHRKTEGGINQIYL